MSKLVCKKCSSDHYVKNGYVQNHQRYRCRSCGYNFTDTAPRGVHPALKSLSLVLYGLGGVSMNKIAKMLGVSNVAERNIALKILTQNIDTQTPEGRLFFHMTAAFDQFQRELIVENTRAGLVAANKRGRRGGRPKGMDEQNIKKAEAMLKDT